MTGVFIPWSGEIVPIPEPPIPPDIPNLTPVPDIPPEPPAAPFPPIGGPIKYLVHGVEAAWSDVASWVSDQWHRDTGAFDDAGIAIYGGVKKIVDNALGWEQTAWASFTATLENQLLANLRNITAEFDDLTQSLYDNVNALWDAIYHEQIMITSWALDSMRAIDNLLAGAVNNFNAAIDNLRHDLQQWVITDVYDVLLGDILRAIQYLEGVAHLIQIDLQQQVDRITNTNLPRLGAEIGAVAAAVAALDKWVQECGEPMCVQMGPKTDWSKLLKLLNVAGMLALLTTVGALTETQLEQLASTVAALGSDPAGAFVSAFVSDGDTLADAILSTIPQLGL